MLTTTSNLESAAMECSNQLKKELMSRKDKNILEGINSADEAILSKALLIKDPYGNTLLHYAAQYAESVALITLLKKVSADALSASLLITNKVGSTALHTAREERFIVLVDHASAETLSTAVLLQNDYGSTPLHHAAYTFQAANFIALINKVSVDVLSTALVARNGIGGTPLHDAAERLTYKGLLALIEKIGIDTLSDALMVKDDFGDTPLHRAAYKSDPAFFIALIQNISVDTLSSAMLARDKKGVTPFHEAAKFQTSVALITLMEKLGIDALSTALLVADDEGGTPLHRAAEKYHSENFIAIIQNTSDDVLSTALLMQKSNGYTPLHLAAMNLNPLGFNAIIETLSVDTLSAALVVKDINGATPLHKVAKSPNLAGLIASINKANDQTIPAIVVIIKECNLTSQNALKALLSRCDTVLGLSLFDNDKMSGPLKNLLSDSAFDPNLADIHLKFFTNKMASANLDRIWEKINRGRELLPKVRLRMQLMTVLMGKPAFSLTPDEIDFFRYLKKITVEQKDKIDTLIRQHLANRSLSAMFFSRDNHLDTAYINLLQTEAEQIPDLVFDETIKLTQKISKNQILIKIVAPKDHSDFMKQLENYHYRPALRAKIPNPKYKLVHLTGEVVTYQYHNPKNKASYTHTKKSSATILGETLSTPVFGQHDLFRPLVGYLFNKRDCVIKAMLRQDQGTYGHQWLAQTEEEAKNAAHLIPNYNFTDESAFLNEINTDSSRTNEVLVKVKKEAIVAIVIARKDNNSISIAKERQNEVRDKLGLDLPVVFYDSNNGVLELVQEKLGNNAQKLKIN